MNVPNIPEIENFTEMYDLLRNYPEYQKRMAEMKELGDYINTRIGTLDVVQDIRAKQGEANDNLRSAREIKAAAEEDAAKLTAKMEAEYDRHRALIATGQAEFKRREADIELRHGQLKESERANAEWHASVKQTEDWAKAKLIEIDQRSSDLNEQAARIANRLEKMRVVWNG